MDVRWTGSKIATVMMVCFLSSTLCYSKQAETVIAVPNTVKVDKDFSYTLLTSNPLRFNQGYGEIEATQGPMAQELDRLLQTSKKSILAAIYGVSKQDWFFDTISKMKHRLHNAVRAVVDQKSGKLGQWLPKNFTYKDTYRLGQVLGEKQILPDISSKNRVRRSTIMHNKFFVTDNKKLWIGSANISSTGIGSGYNANNVLILDHPEIAQIFADEFDHMFRARSFSNGKSPHRKDIYKFKDGSEVRAYFSPQDPVIQEGIVASVEKAKATIDIAMFYLTEPNVVDALVKAAGRGVGVRVILDALAAHHGSSPVDEMKAAGIKLRVESWGGKMHMKTAVIDSATTIIGSMNWSIAGATKNDESTLVIKNQALAIELGQYYEKLWSSLTPAKAGTPTRKLVRAESLSSLNSCFDGIDNDYDGYVDGEDSGCVNAILKQNPLYKIFMR